jgi:hypothetical protein
MRRESTCSCHYLCETAAVRLRYGSVLLGRDGTQ